MIRISFFDIEDFVKAYDANGINAPIDCVFCIEKDEIDATSNSIHNNSVTILTGSSGIGKNQISSRSMSCTGTQRI